MVRSIVLGTLLAFSLIVAGCDDDDDAEVDFNRIATFAAEDNGALRTVLSEIPALGWSTGAQMPTPRAEVAAAAIDRNIYVVGGFTENGQNFSTVEVYDTETDTWSSIDPMPERLDHAMAAAANGKLYVMGGWRVFGEQASDAAHEYDPATERWRSVASMPFPRAAGAAASDGSTIYVVGGVGPEPEVALAYDVAAGEWRRIASIAEPREHLAAAAVDGRIFAIGGRWSDRGNAATVEEYDPETGTWRPREPMPTARGGLAAGVIGYKIHVVGGESFGNGSRTFEEHEVYRPESQLGDPGFGDTWETEDPLPTSRHGLAAAVVSDRLYVIAGGETPGLSVSEFVEILVPLVVLDRSPITLENWGYADARLAEGVRRVSIRSKGFQTRSGFVLFLGQSDGYHVAKVLVLDTGGSICAFTKVSMRCGHRTLMSAS